MNTVNWTLWLILAMTYCALTYNPLYQLLLLAVIATIALVKKHPLITYVKVGLVVSVIPLFVNTFLIHRGQTVITTVPKSIQLLGLDIPLLVFAGNITLESTLTGVIMTVFLVNMLTAFQVYSRSTSPDSILRLMPSYLPGASLAVSIALRFIPTVVRDNSSIRDAQAARGVRLNSGSLPEKMRNQAATLVPTVITSLERGFNLAESMASRGYTGKMTRYRRMTWGGGEKITSVVLALAATSALYAKLTGLTDYWPYDSLMPPQASFIAVLPLIALTIPYFMKDERS